MTADPAAKRTPGGAAWAVALVATWLVLVVVAAWPVPQPEDALPVGLLEALVLWTVLYVVSVPLALLLSHALAQLRPFGSQLAQALTAALFALVVVASLTTVFVGSLWYSLGPALVVALATAAGRCVAIPFVPSVRARRRASRVE